MFPIDIVKVDINSVFFKFPFVITKISLATNMLKIPPKQHPLTNDKIENDNTLFTLLNKRRPIKRIAEAAKSLYFFILL
jgi:hypothetical protein